MSIRSEDQRRPLYRRPPPLSTPTSLPRPYTTFNQPAGERLHLTPADVNLNPLSPQSGSQSVLATRLVSEGLGNIADQINSTENQARLSQNAMEVAQAANTATQLKKDLKDWRVSETSNIDKQINDELARQGITKQQLQNSPRLRAVVSKWKAQIYAGLNSNLDKNEQQVISGTQTSLTEAQQTSRGELSKSISSYETEITPQVNQAIQGAQQNRIVDTLVNSGMVSRNGDNIQLTKPVEDLTSNDIKQLNSVGFDITQDQVNQAVTASQQQKTVNTLVNSGVVSKSGDNIQLTKPIENLTSDDVKQLNSVGFNITQSDVNTAVNASNQQKTVTSLANNGLIKISGDTVTLNKSVANLTSDDIKQLNSIGFSITSQQVKDAQVSSETSPKSVSSPTISPVVATTKFTIAQIAAQNAKFKAAYDLGVAHPELIGKSGSGAISAAQYNQAVVQQNANLTADQIAQQQAINTLASNGIIATTHNPSTPLQKSLVLAVPLVSVSDADLVTLRSAGFNITSEQATQRIETQNLITAGVVKLSGNTLSLVKPVSTLSDAEIAHLHNIGINVPSLPKGPEQAMIEYSQNIPTKIAPIFSTPTGISTYYAKQNIPNAAALLGDFLRTLAAPIQLVESLIPGTQPLEAGWRGPTSSTLKYYRDVTPTQQAMLTTGGVLSSMAASYLEFMPVGFVAKAIPSLAGGLTTKLLATETGTSIATGLKSIATSLKIGSNAVIDALPIESASAKQLTSAMATLLKNPKFQQALVWGSMAGLNTVDVYSQLTSGKPIDDIIEQSAVKIGGQIGSIKGFQAGYNIAGEKFNQMAKLVRFTGGDVKITPTGEIETPFRQMKDVPKQLRDVYALELDPVTGKIKVVGFITKEGGTIPLGEASTQPIIREYDASAFNKLMQGEKVGLTDAQLNKLSLSELYDQVVLNKNLSANDVKTILVRYIGEDGFKQIELSALKGGGKEFLEMSPKEMRIALYKELGGGSLWTTSLKDFNTELGIRPGGHFEYIGAITDEMKVKIPKEIQTLVNQLKSMGLDDTEASYWASQIMTKEPEKILGKLENIMDNAYDKQRVAELVQYGKGITSGNSTTVQLLESAGLKPNQIENVIKATALSQGDPAAFAATLSDIDPKSAMTTMQMISKDEFASSLIHMEIKPLAIIIDAAVSSANTALIATMVPLMAMETLTGVLNNLSSEGINAIAQDISPSNLTSVISNSKVSPEIKLDLITNITPEQLNKIVPQISNRDLTSIIPKLSPDVLTQILPNLAQEQLNEIIQKLSPEQLNEIIPDLSQEQLNEIMQKLEITPEAMIDFIQIQESGGGGGGGGGGTPPGPGPGPPGIIGRISDFHLRQNKREMAKQGIALYDVRLQYHSSSERYKIKSNSFQGAAREALNRKQTKQLPTNIVVAKVYEHKS